MRRKAANIDVALYDGDFEIHFACIGEGKCRYALCSTMPPTDDEPCFHKEYGACNLTVAKVNAISALQDRLRKVLKEYEEVADE